MIGKQDAKDNELLEGSIASTSVMIVKPLIFLKQIQIHN